MPVISDPEGRLFRMNRVSQISFDNYTPAGDVAVVAICLVMVILLLTSYVSRTRSFRIFANILVSLVIAALVNIVYHALLSNYTPGFRIWIYITRVLYEAMLYGVFFLFALYSIEITGLERRRRASFPFSPPCCLSGSSRSTSSARLPAPASVLRRTAAFSGARMSI